MKHIRVVALLTALSYAQSGATQDANTDTQDILAGLLLCSALSVFVASQSSTDELRAGYMQSALFHHEYARTFGATDEMLTQTGKQIDFLSEKGIISLQEAYGFIFDVCEPIRDGFRD